MNENNLKNALWGIFISDAMSMPAHWYYKREYIKEGFDGWITEYQHAPHPHPESFMVGNGYHPNIEKAKTLERPFDILHQHSKFYKTNYHHSDITLSVHAGEHKNPMPMLEERYHYHHALKKGDNTLGANLLRVLMRSIIANDGYSQSRFIDDFISYMTTPYQNKDPMLTLKHYASKVQRIKIKGSELTKCYAEHQGPGNIPKDEMWKIHTEFSDKSLDLDYLMDHYTEDEILGTVFTTGCYTEHSLPVLMYLIYRYKFDFKASVLANANAGGDNVHRGIILGMLAGAANDEIPEDLKEGLSEYENIKKEIDALVDLIVSTKDTE